MASAITHRLAITLRGSMPVRVVGVRDSRNYGRTESLCAATLGACVSERWLEAENSPGVRLMAWSLTRAFSFGVFSDWR